MAAIDDLPRGWTFATGGQSVTSPASAITIPAVPGVSHVLTGFNASAEGNGPAVALMVQAGTVKLGSIMVVNATAPAIGTSEASWTGKLFVPAGQALLIQFAGIAGGGGAYTVALDVAGYDI